jgi:hypothetical protein
VASGDAAVWLIVTANPKSLGLQVRSHVSGHLDVERRSLGDPPSEPDRFFPSSIAEGATALPELTLNVR